jgi:ABC-type multidrug transport system ATPase subunit
LQLVEHGAEVVAASMLGKQYGGRPVIQGVAFRLGAGSMLGLVGANGGGKTTTLRMLAGIVRPDEGEGHVLGHDLRCPGMQLRRCVGYMSQRMSLYPDLSVAENLRFRAEIHGLANPRQAVEAVALRCDLSSVLATRVDRLSSGWARRAQFAAVLMNRPRLLLLDEPTAGLDAATRRTIWRWLQQLAAAGHTIVISTHDLAEAEACPMVLHYADGRAHGPMPPAVLIAAGGAASLEQAILALAAGPPA